MWTNIGVEKTDVLFTFEKVTRCPFFAKFVSPFERTKARTHTECPGKPRPNLSFIWFLIQIYVTHVANIITGLHLSMSRIKFE
jgi:hypothetical protein